MKRQHEQERYARAAHNDEGLRNPAGLVIRAPVNDRERTRACAQHDEKPEKVAARPGPDGVCLDVSVPVVEAREGGRDIPQTPNFATENDGQVFGK